MALTPYQTAARAGLAAFNAAAGLTVTVARGSSETEDVPALKIDRGNSVQAVEGVYGLVSEVGFIIAKAEYLIGGSEVAPARGDVITYDSRRFDVLDGTTNLDESAEWLIPVQEVG